MGQVFQAETIAYLKTPGKKVKKEIHLPFYLAVYLSVCVYVLHSFHWSYNGDYTHRLKPHARQPMQTLQGDALKPVLCLLAHLTLKGFCWKKLRYLLGRYFWNAIGYTVLSQWKEMFASLSPQVKSARFERDCLETRACTSETYKTGFWIERRKVGATGLKWQSSKKLQVNCTSTSGSSGKIQKGLMTIYLVQIWVIV